MKQCCADGCSLCSGWTYTENQPIDTDSIKRYYISAMHARRAGDNVGFLNDLRLIGKELGVDALYHP